MTKRSTWAAEAERYHPQYRYLRAPCVAHRDSAAGKAWLVMCCRCCANGDGSQFPQQDGMEWAGMFPGGNMGVDRRQRGRTAG
jgi:hypothetical protein